MRYCVLVFRVLTALPLPAWIPDQVRNDGRQARIPDRVRNDEMGGGAPAILRQAQDERRL